MMRYLGDRHAWFFAVLELLKPRAKKLDDFVEVGRFFFTDAHRVRSGGGRQAPRVPRAWPAHLRALDEAFGAARRPSMPPRSEAALRAVADARGVKAATLIHAVRVAVTGKTASPGPLRGARAARPRAHARRGCGRASADFRGPTADASVSISARSSSESAAACGRGERVFHLPDAAGRLLPRKMFSISAFIAESYGQLVAHRLQPEHSRAPTDGVREEGMVAKEDRGFASMDRSKQREIASKGGKAAHQKGTAHEWTSEEAREAGRKGGMASHRRKRAAGRPEPASGDPSMNENRATPASDGGVFDVLAVASAPSASAVRLPAPLASGYNREFLALRARPTGTGRSSNGRTLRSGRTLSGFESLPPSQSLCSIPSLSIAASCLVRFQLLLSCAERDSRQEPPLTSTTSVAWPEPGKFESQTGLARHESVPSGSVPGRAVPYCYRMR